MMAQEVSVVIGGGFFAIGGVFFRAAGSFPAEAESKTSAYSFLPMLELSP